MSSLFGLLRYSAPNNAYTPFTNCSKHSTKVLSPIRTYSSQLSADDPFKTSENTGDRFNTLMPLLEPAIPKNACQIHKSFDATTSSMCYVFAIWPSQVFSTKYYVHSI